MAASHLAFLELLNQGQVATGDALTEWMATDADTLDDLDESAREQLEPASLFRVAELRTAVEADVSVLAGFAEKAEAVGPDADPKLHALKEELTKIAAEAAAEGLVEQDVRDKRKVVVFSYYADTVKWLGSQLPSVLASDPVAVRPLYGARPR